MDGTYYSGGSSKSATRAQLDAEKADTKDLMMLATVTACHLVGILKEVAESRLYADEKREGLKIAKQVCGAICDGMDDFNTPIRRRAAAAGLVLDDYTPDKTELEALFSKLAAMLRDDKSKPYRPEAA